MHYNTIPSNFNHFYLPSPIKTGEIYVSNRTLEHINCILPGQINRGALYLGDVVSTLKIQLLQKHQIKAVLTCMTEPISRFNQNILAHKILPIRDNLEFPIAQYFIQAKKFIDQARSKGLNVLVHCHAGVSRSAAIVCAYLMLENIWTAQSALDFVRQKRYRAKPNANFLNQLKYFWESQIKIDHISNHQISSKIQLNLTKNEENQTKSFKNQKKNVVIGQKTIFITLDQEIETHDELLQLDQKKKLLKQKHSDIRTDSIDKKQRGTSKLQNIFQQQEVNRIKQRRIFKTLRRHQEENNVNSVYEHEKLQTNKSSIYFNKAFDPKLVKSTVEIKNTDVVKRIQNKQINQMQSNSCILGQHQNTIHRSQKQAHKSMNGSIIFNQKYMTPAKQKRDVQSSRIPFSYAYDQGSNGTGNLRVSHRVLYDGTPKNIVIDYGERTPKHSSRYSLTGYRKLQ